MKFLYLFLLALFLTGSVFAKDKLFVVGTVPSFTNIAKYIGGDKIEVHSIAKGYQDPHLINPKPTLAVILSKADLFISSGMDLEMWAATLVDKSKNQKIRSGQKGYVAVSYGLDIMEKPKVISRSEGDVHIYGNPHIHTCPLNAIKMAENIFVGLSKVDPSNAAYYEKNLNHFKMKVYYHLFGSKLVDLLGASVLVKLLKADKLIEFLKNKAYKGSKLIDLLGGWLQKALPLRGQKFINYHKNWTYFARTFGLIISGYLEPKPGIPPSAKHVVEIINMMKVENIRVIFDANYFDESRIHQIAAKVKAKAVIMCLDIEGEPGVTDYFQLVDIWITRLNNALQ